MRLLKPIIAIVLCLNVAVVAFAHPGRTDSSGGHYNRSTGEYHYHHGYSAHQHTDTNSDGILECPYLIDGKIVSNSGIKSGKIEVSNGETDSKDQEAKSSKKSSKDWWKNAGVLIICAIFFGFGFIVDGIKYVIDKIKQRRNR